MTNIENRKVKLSYSNMFNNPNQIMFFLKICKIGTRKQADA